MQEPLPLDEVAFQFLLGRLRAGKIVRVLQDWFQFLTI